MANRPQESSIPAPSDARDGRSDFDFLVGAWSVRNRRLRVRLSGCTEWDEFPSTCRSWTILDGLGNQDVFTLDTPEGRVVATTVRLYDPAADEWTLNWASTATPGRFDPPVIGRFHGARGEFYSHEPYVGRHILARFVWTAESERACRWEQAYSVDGGRTWETNWIMELTRE